MTFSGHRWLGCCHSEAFSANGTSLRSHKAKFVGGKSMAGRSAGYHRIKHKTMICKFFIHPRWLFGFSSISRVRMVFNPTYLE